MFFFKCEFNPKTYKLCLTCKHFKCSMNKNHLICRFFIIAVVKKIIFQKVKFPVFNMSGRCYLIVMMPDSY